MNYKDTRKPELSIIIVNWNAKDVLRDCLTSIYSTIKKTSFEIIIVDNCSSDGSVEMIRNNFPEVTLIPETKNLGFSKANNAAFPYAAGKYILALNPDVILLEGSIDKMVAFLDKHEDVGILGPKIFNKDGEISSACKRKLPTVLRSAKRIFLIDNIVIKVKSILCKISPPIKDKIHSYYNQTEECEFTEGSCLLIRRELFEILKGFDETVPMYLDDVDICFRARKMGQKIFYLANASIIHLGSHSTKKKNNHKIFDVLLLQANVVYFRKHYGMKTVMVFKSLIGLSIPFLLLLDILTFPLVIVKGEIEERMWVIKKHLKYINIIFNTDIQCLSER